MADTDLIDLLIADHQTLLGAQEAAVVADLSQHLSIERDLLYRGIEEFCIDGEQTVGRMRRDDLALEVAMKDFESAATPEHRAALERALENHIAYQQDHLFPELRKCIPGWWLIQVVDMVPLVIGGSPTHGHRHLSESGPVREVAEDLSSIADYIRDRGHRRH